MYNFSLSNLLFSSLFFVGLYCFMQISHDKILKSAHRWNIMMMLFVSIVFGFSIKSVEEFNFLQFPPFKRLKFLSLTELHNFFKVFDVGVENMIHYHIIEFRRVDIWTILWSITIGNRISTFTKQYAICNYVWLVWKLC